MNHAAMHSLLVASGPALREHLVASTLFLAAVLAASLLPFLRPRTRYALTLLGVARFLVPGAILSAVAERLTPDAVELPSFSVTAALGLSAGSRPDSEILCVTAAVWLAGTLAVSLRLVTARLRWRRAVRGASAASGREIATMRRVAERFHLRTTPRVARFPAAVPMTAGLLRPVVLLPDSSVDRLDDDELTAVLAHELGHVERRHNLAAVVQNAVAALFWFHPAIWLAAGRLHTEAEKDCDERALGFVPDPPAYFSGMLKVCRGFIAPQPAGVSCMSTTRLKERMEHLMKHHRSNTRSVPHRLAIGAAVAALLLTSVLASAGTPGAKDDGVTLPKIVTKVDAVYPPAARKKRIEGTVVVSTNVDEKGNVASVSVAEGIEGEEGEAFEEAAMAAVRQWKFEPARKNGKAVPITFELTVRFVLEKASKK